MRDSMSRESQNRRFSRPLSTSTSNTSLQSSCYSSSNNSSSSCSNSSEDSGTETIALFGPDGKCGYHFLRLALDAGYHVHVLLSPKVSLRVLQEFAGHPRLAVTTGELNDEEAMEEVVYGADYVVCMLNDTLPSKRDYPEHILAHFISRLYSILKSQRSNSANATKLVVFQSNSLAPCVKGGTPILSKVLKTAARSHCAASRDQSSVVKFIGWQHGIRRKSHAAAQQQQSASLAMHKKGADEMSKGCGSAVGEEDDDDDDENSTSPQAPQEEQNPSKPAFDFLITRPTLLLQDGPPSSKGVMKASKSQPGPFPARYVDVASFTLNALHNERLRNTSPYLVVGDV